jgi:hypothetical protein
VRLGLEKAREGAGIVYTHRAPVPTYDIHTVDRYLSVTGVLGLDDSPLDFRIYLPAEAETGVTRLLAEHGLAAIDRFKIIVGSSKRLGTMAIGRSASIATRRRIQIVGATGAINPENRWLLGTANWAILAKTTSQAGILV